MCGITSIQTLSPLQEYYGIMSPIGLFTGGI